MVYNAEAGFNRLAFTPGCSEKEALKLSYSASEHVLITCRSSTELIAQGTLRENDTIFFSKIITVSL